MFRITTWKWFAPGRFREAFSRVPTNYPTYNHSFQFNNPTTTHTANASTMSNKNVHTWDNSIDGFYTGNTVVPERAGSVPTSTGSTTAAAGASPAFRDTLGDTIKKHHMEEWAMIQRKRRKQRKQREADAVREAEPVREAKPVREAEMPQPMTRPAKTGGRWG